MLRARLAQSGTDLQYSLRLSFYHAGSKRFYGNTFQGQSSAAAESEVTNRCIYIAVDGISL